MTFKALLLVTVFAASFSMGTAKSFDEAVVDVPFTFDSGYVVVQAKIKDDIPVELVVSTGSQFSSFDTAFLEKYKLQAYYAAVGIVTGHDDRVIALTRVPNLRIGPERHELLIMRLVSLAGLRQRVGSEVAGVLGADFLNDRSVQFDFARKVLRFLPKTDNQATSKAGGFSHRSILPMTDVSDRLVMPIVNTVTINSKKIRTSFDTGRVTVVSLSAAAAKQVGLAPAPDKTTPRADKISSLRLSENDDISDLPVLIYAEKGSDFEKDQLEFGALVGTVFLQNFLATFDYRKKVIILER